MQPNARARYVVVSSSNFVEIDQSSSRDQMHCNIRKTKLILDKDGSLQVFFPWPDYCFSATTRVSTYLNETYGVNGLGYASKKPKQ